VSFFSLWNLGPQTRVMRKAKMSFQSGQVKQVIRTYAVEIQTSDKKELEEEAVTMMLRKAMGANCEFFSLSFFSLLLFPGGGVGTVGKKE
jgi:hypothetical protein